MSKRNLSFLLGGIFLVLFYQNCGEGFDSGTEGSSDSLSIGDDSQLPGTSNPGTSNPTPPNTGNPTTPPSGGGGTTPPPSGGNPTPPPSNGALFNCLSDNMLQLALNQGLIRFDQTLKGGAHTWTFHYAEVALAVHAACGDTRADARLLQHIRNVLTPGNGPTAQGGYADQHQVGILTAFTIIEKIPRLWSQLSAAEKAKIDLIFEAALVSNAFVSADANPFVTGGTQQYTIDGSTNFNRGWNPNHRAGTIGSVIIASAHLGLNRAKSMLANHRHQSFISRLNAAGLTNLVRTYNSSSIPSDSQIETTHRSPFSYYNIPHDNLLDMFIHLADYTYNRNVSCGLNNGNGITQNGVTGGMLTRNCAGLPNKGQIGMLTEFDAQDANGKRSSASYAFSGLRPVNTIQLALIANNLWQDNATTANLIAKMKIGIEDFYYKVDPQIGGYVNYAKGRASTTTSYIDTKQGHELVFDVLVAIGMDP